MPLPESLDPSDVTERAKQLLEGIQETLGWTPELFKTMAHSPAVLQAQAGIRGVQKEDHLPVALREQIAMAVSDLNGCESCWTAHTTIARMAGLGQEEIRESRLGRSKDVKIAAALRFAQHLAETKGHVEDGEFSRLKKAGYPQAEIADIVSNVFETLFTNYLNHVSESEVDLQGIPETAGA